MKMKKHWIHAFIVIAIGLIFSNSAIATLIPRGNSLIYDSDLDITWLQNADPAVDTGYCADILPTCTNGLMTKAEAIKFVNWFNNMYFPPWPTGQKNWRFPKTPTAPDSTCSENFNEGYGCTHSEFGHLYYVELGNLSGEGGLINRGDFRDIEIQMNYWTEWDFVSPEAPPESVTFKFRTGLQTRSQDTERHYVWLVHDGDIAPRTECNDGLDNDGDGRIDMQDTGCQNPGDNDEREISLRYRSYVYEFIPNYAFYDFVARGGRWSPPGLPGPQPHGFSVNNPEKTLPAYMDSLGKAIWKISNASRDAQKIDNSLNELNGILKYIPVGKYFDNNMREQLVDLINTARKFHNQNSAGDFLNSPVFIKSLNAIDLDWRLPEQKRHKIMKASYFGVDLEGMVYVGLRDVTKPGEMTLKIVSGYDAFPTDTIFSPTWPFLTYEISFNGGLGSKGFLGLTFYIKPLRFGKNMASIRVLRVDKEGLTDVTTGMDLSRGFVMARTDRSGTFIIVGKDR